MSIIGVKYHNEDIHNIISKPSSPKTKLPTYKAKGNIRIPIYLREKLKYNGHQSFGLPHYEIPKCSSYLKKGKPKIEHPALKLLDRNEFKCTTQKNPPLPKQISLVRKKSSKNFVKENIKMIANIEPKIPPPRRVDSPRGTVKEMAHLIQMIKIRQSDEYGKIPKYLRIKKQLSENYRKGKEQHLFAVNEYKKRLGIGSMGMNEKFYMVDEETRQKLLEGLKENWNELFQKFLRLPVMSDTLTKIRRKIWLEKELDQLEKDVKLLETHPYIYLERNDPRPIEEIIAEEQILEEMRAKKTEVQEKRKSEESGKIIGSQEVQNCEKNVEDETERKTKEPEQLQEKESEKKIEEKVESKDENRIRSEAEICETLLKN